MLFDVDYEYSNDISLNWVFKPVADKNYFRSKYNTTQKSVQGRKIGISHKDRALNLE